MVNVQYIKEQELELRRILKRIKYLLSQLKRKQKSLLRLNELYNSGFIDNIEYKRVSMSIKKDIFSLENEIRYLLGEAKEILEDLKRLNEFKKEISKITKPRIQIPQISIETYAQQIANVERFLPPKEITETKEPKVVIGKRFKEIRKILFSSLKKKEEKTVLLYPRIRRKKKLSTLNINYTQYIIKIANKLFGKVSDFIIENFPSVYGFIYDLLKRAGIYITVRTYISIVLFIFTLVIVPSLIITFLAFGFSPFTILIPIILVFVFILIALYYPEHEKKSKAEEIKAVLPFAIIHMSSLAQAGINIKDVFRIIAETKEYKSLSEEFQKVVEYLDMGMGLSDALRTLISNTYSEDLKEFLGGLLLSLQSGSSLKEYLQISAESAIIHYKSLNQKFIQTIKTFSDIYVGMVITMPMILVSIIIMLSSLAGRVFGLPIPQLTLILVYIVVPAINIGMLILIDKIQPK